jgi:hypothetical protein
MAAAGAIASLVLKRTNQPDDPKTYDAFAREQVPPYREAGSGGAYLQAERYSAACIRLATA